MEALPTLSAVQYELVYNMLSLAIAAMFASFAFFVMARQQLTSKYRPAMIMSSLVVGIAGYHYGVFSTAGAMPTCCRSGQLRGRGQPFNDAYRYVDWLLTVPLSQLSLSPCSPLLPVRKLMTKLVIAAVLMIATGYPGGIATDNVTRSGAPSAPSRSSTSCTHGLNSARPLPALRPGHQLGNTRLSHRNLGLLPHHLHVPDVRPHRQRRRSGIRWVTASPTSRQSVATAS